MQIDKKFVHVDYVGPNTGINAPYTLRIVLAKKPLIKYLFIPMVNNILPSSITEIVTLIDSCGNYMYKQLASNATLVYNIPSCCLID